MRIAFALLLGFAGCAQQAQPAEQPAAQAPPTQGVRVVRTYPHDPGAFTQGLFWLEGKLYESTGLVGQSTIREVNLEDGRVLRSTDIPAGLFGEGIVNWGDEVLSITWQDNVGFRWDRRTFRQTGQWNYGHEGWGLTQDGRRIIMSDGSPILRFLDPRTMQEVGRIEVTSAGQPVARLNELEYVKGEILANVWQTAFIARIDPATGEVKGWIDLRPLAAQNGGGTGEDNVLNGIAYDPDRDRLFVTGKNWPRLYEIDLLPPAAR
ncbi:glutaminyl-peptide cyclotransferase [Allosphingosinicella sp.]|jgi:glutaminyl-peptide cyclotransferase|uniref:glutaminyl-peptide cyclotransferase n=1 Tax=Allosphingosinicella sp. TaxID=2823234 RepID=UPI002F08AF2A